MKFPLHTLLIAFSLSLCGGCAVYKTARPNVSGTVIVGTSKTPISGAQVSLKGEPKTYVTDSTGSFSIPARKKWFFIPVVFPVDYSPGPMGLVVTKEGYRPWEETVSWKAAREGVRVELQRSRDITIANGNLVVARNTRVILPRAERKKIPANVTMRQLIAILGPGWNPEFISCTNVMWCFDDGVRLSSLYSGDLDRPVTLKEDKYVQP
jgi:hypothetical protein